MNERYYSYEIYPYDRGDRWVANLMYGPMVVEVKLASTQASATRRGRRMAKRANRRLSNERRKR